MTTTRMMIRVDEPDDDLAVEAGVAPDPPAA
jgi:hypothetical protein